MTKSLSGHPAARAAGARRPSRARPRPATCCARWPPRPGPRRRPPSSSTPPATATRWPTAIRSASRQRPLGADRADRRRSRHGRRADAAARDRAGAGQADRGGSREPWGVRQHRRARPGPRDGAVAARAARAAPQFRGGSGRSSGNEPSRRRSTSIWPLWRIWSVCRGSARPRRGRSWHFATAPAHFANLTTSGGFPASPRALLRRLAGRAGGSVTLTGRASAAKASPLHPRTRDDCTRTPPPPNRPPTPPRPPSGWASCCWPRGW